MILVLPLYWTIRTECLAAPQAAYYDKRQKLQHKKGFIAGFQIIKEEEGERGRMRREGEKKRKGG